MLNLHVVSNMQETLSELNKSVNVISKSIQNEAAGIGGSFKKLMAFDAISNGLGNMKMGFDNLIAPALTFNHSMKELQAITNVGDGVLKKIGGEAKKLALTFGTDASTNVESFKLLLSKLGPEVANNTEVLALMGRNVNLLSKSMSGDTKAAADTLTTAMNQYGVSMKDPLKAGSEMTKMMNTMSAAAQLGSAEMPQIQQAVENVGAVAKASGLSFSEMNASIQFLDKAGKKGAEGGVALRNVLSTMSKGDYASKDAEAGFKRLGISMSDLGNSSIPIEKRLNSLKPLLKDNALLGAVFGVENTLAARALIENATGISEFSKQIENTNSAQEQATIIMSSWQEKLKRQAAYFDNLKISIGEAMGPIIPFTSSLLGGVSAAGSFSSSLVSISTILNTDYVKGLYKSITGLFVNTTATNSNSLANSREATMLFYSALAVKLKEKALGGLTRATVLATTGVRGFSFALSSIPFLGWLAAGITAAAIAIKYAWDNSKQFRATLFGVWEAAKAVFNNISIVVGRLWNLALKPMLTGFWNTSKMVFNFFLNIVKTVFNGVVSFYSAYLSLIKSIFTGIINVVSFSLNYIGQGILKVGSFIGRLFGGLWGWFSSLFKGFAKFVNDWIVEPIRSAFSGVWNFIVSVVDSIKQKLVALIQPVIDLYNKVFSSEGMTDVKASYEIGYKKGEVSFDKSKGETSPVTASKSETSPSFDLSTMVNNKVNAGSDKATKDKTTKTSEDTGGSNKKTNITIMKMIDTLNIHMRAGDRADADNLKSQVTNIMASVVNDANGFN